MSVEAPELAADRFEDRAVELLKWLAEEVRAHRPTVCTAAAMFRILFPGQPPDAFLPERARLVAQIAATTAAMYVHGIGPVRLEAFLVEEATARPPERLWEHVRFSPLRWEAVLGQARVLG